MDIVGNKLADKVAKEAIRWKLKKTRKGRTRESDTGSTTTQTPLAKKLVSAKAAILGKRYVAKWKNKWKKKTRGQELYQLELETKSNILKPDERLSKELGSLVIQMEMGKIGF